MHTNADKIIKIMEHIAPEKWAEPWDNVGLLVGQKHKMIQNVLVALEVTDAVVDEAIEKNVDMIIVHHPLIFKAMKTITDDDPISKMVIKLIKNDINLYVAHTNLDASPEGTSAYLAEVLELSDIKVLDESLSAQWFKIHVYVPIDQTEQVKKAMFDHGAGKIQTYDHCAYTIEGQGQFRPLEGSKPFIGQENSLTQVAEVKIEVMVPEHLLNPVVEAMIKAHPYEVPAYDVFKTERVFSTGGIGVHGKLKKPLTLLDLSQQVKALLNLQHLKFVGKEDQMMHRVSIVTGAGADYMKLAKIKSDVLITGDVKYHEAQDALQMGLALIDGGHYETEVFYMSRLKEILDKIFEEKSYDVQVIMSETDINPFKHL